MRILAVAAHPDDEVLGVGATLARHAARGDEVHVVILGQGALSRGGGPEAAQEAERLYVQARQAGDVLGCRTVSFEKLPDQRFETVPIAEIADRVSHHVQRLNPEIVYTHHHGDLNSDHRRSCEATLIACRAMPGCGVREVLMWETLSSTEWSPKSEPFLPNVYVDVDAFVDKKAAALTCYEGELRPYPHPRSVEGVRILARARGLEVGLLAAEAFAVFRIIR